MNRINRDEECSFMAREILKRCADMSVPVRERESHRNVWSALDNE
jgi:hypothetical protein